MTIMGVNFTKINVERKKATRDKVNVSNNVSITNVERVLSNFGGPDRMTLRFIFGFVSKYEPEVGNINLDGEVIYLVPSAKGEEILAGWAKGKKLDPQIMSVIMNNALHKCNIEAILLSREMNLPSPIPLPRVNVGQPKQPEEKAEKPKAEKKSKK